MSLYKSDNEPIKVLTSLLKEEKDSKVVLSELKGMCIYKYMREYGRHCLDSSKLLSLYEREKKYKFRGFAFTILDFYKKSFVSWGENYVKEYHIHSVSLGYHANYKSNEDAEICFLRVLENNPNLLKVYNKSYTRHLILDMGKYSPTVVQLKKLLEAEENGLSCFLKTLCSEMPQMMLHRLVKNGAVVLETKE